MDLTVHSVNIFRFFSVIILTIRRLVINKRVLQGWDKKKTKQFNFEEGRLHLPSVKNTIIF